MNQYANTGDCLQQFILRYFGQVSDPCGRCSNCLDERASVDVTTDAQKVLSCVYRMHERFGKSLIADVLAGAKTKRVLELHFDELSTYGLLRQMTKKTITGFIDFLTAGGYLEAIGGQYPTLRVTALGAAVLRGQETVARKQAAAATRTQPVDSDLFQALRALRRELAEKQGVPPYVIFSDQTLRDLCAMMPTTEAEMLAVKGIGHAKFDKYGAAFLDALAQAAD